MNLTTIIYTTAKAKGGEFWFERTFPEIYRVIARAKAVEVAPFTVREIGGLPDEVPTYTSDGTYIDWDWLKRNCPSDGHNAVCLHISEEERERFGLKHPNGGPLGGVYHTDPDGVFDFVIIADSRSEFTRLFTHELSHGFAHWTVASDQTHYYDYVLRNVPAAFPTYNFTDWSLRKEIVRLGSQVVALLTKLLPMNNSLCQVAIAAVGTDPSPRDAAPDELGCAETVSSLIRTAVPDFPVVTGTWTLWDLLEAHPRFEKVSGEPRCGDVIISPTVPGKPFPGHAGIFNDRHAIMSNNSKTGIFEPNYTLAGWNARYATVGGYPVHIYRLKP